jgi:hypothetical protein
LRRVIGAADDHRPARTEPQVDSQPRRLIERVRAPVQQAAPPHVVWGDVLGRLPEQLAGDLAPTGDPRLNLPGVPLLRAVHRALDQLPLPALGGRDAHPGDRATVRPAYLAADDRPPLARRSGARAAGPAPPGPTHPRHGVLLHRSRSGDGSMHPAKRDGFSTGETYVNTVLLQQVLAEPAWAKKLSDEDRRGLTALFWSNINPYGTFRLDMDKRLDLGPPRTVPRPRTSATAEDQPATETRRAR